ncbi:MAG: dihydrolipoyl dehydrogenase [Lachnospiraceae bacterium]|nr:dihydrolipoyl dehydrogenase [Lachnospiraceae bacterium]
MSTYQYDVAVLGGGPGGYEAAIRCADLGQRTVLIEADELGGTCLNRGCIPTKALLEGAHRWESLQKAGDICTVEGTMTLDYAKLAAKKNSVVTRMRRGVAALEKGHGVTVVKAFGVLEAAHTILVDSGKITADKMILAMGSEPSRPPIPGIDGENILTSNEVLALESIPESVTIIGGGVIGMEFATLFAALGVKITVLEMMPSILPGVDEDIVSLLSAGLAKKGVRILTEAKVLALQGGATTAVRYEKDGKENVQEADACIVCIGRRPCTSKVGLEKLGIRMNRAFVDVDDSLRTSIPNIYAIGDITGKLQLAHTASAQGLVAAACCAGQKKTMRYDIIPACVYCDPEIAYVGLSEKKLKEQGRAYTTGSFPEAGKGSSVIMDCTTGFAKILSDPDTGEILGAQIMAPRATDMIGEIAAVMRCEGTIEELADTIHPHPTVSEILMEAAHDTEGLCCHAMPKKKG